jgi:uncharacterized membrane protein YbhN (UPF0104 family)
MTVDAELITVPSRAHRHWRLVAIAVIGFVLGLELALGWHSLAAALSQLSAPRPAWLFGALAAELASMRAYARMQRRLLRSAGVNVPLVKHIALAYAAHSLSVTLPGGPAFSTSFNFKQMRRFGASPAVASWCIALSAILSASALTLVTVAGGLAAGGVPDWPRLAAYLVAGALLTVTAYRVARYPQALYRAARAVLATINRVRRRPAYQGHDRVTEFIDQVRSVRLHPAHATVAGFYAVANWLLDALCLWMSCRALGVNTITTSQLLVAYCAGMAAASIPIVPGGLGIIDSALILGLVTSGIRASSAIAVVVLYRIISLGFIIGTGWLIWLLIRSRNRASDSPAEFDDTGVVDVPTALE